MVSVVIVADSPPTEVIKCENWHSKWCSGIARFHTSHTHFTKGQNEPKTLALKSFSANQNRRAIENRIHTKPSTTGKKLRQQNMPSELMYFTFHFIRRLIFSFNGIPQKRARHTKNFKYTLTRIFDLRESATAAILRLLSRVCFFFFLF